jgi:hypothetical protein
LERTEQKSKTKIVGGEYTDLEWGFKQMDKP